MHLYQNLIQPPQILIHPGPAEYNPFFDAADALFFPHCPSFAQPADKKHSAVPYPSLGPSFGKSGKSLVDDQVAKERGFQQNRRQTLAQRTPSCKTPEKPLLFTVQKKIFLA